jgi:hypothetical protein
MLILTVFDVEQVLCMAETTAFCDVKWPHFQKMIHQSSLDNEWRQLRHVCGRPW